MVPTPKLSGAIVGVELGRRDTSILAKPVMEDVDRQMAVNAELVMH